jgi:hypothetical protein
MDSGRQRETMLDGLTSWRKKNQQWIYLIVQGTGSYGETRYLTFVGRDLRRKRWWWAVSCLPISHYTSHRNNIIEFNLDSLLLFVMSKMSNQSTRLYCLAIFSFLNGSFYCIWSRVKHNYLSAIQEKLLLLLFTPSNINLITSEV